MRFLERLRFGFEQDLDERARAIELRAYRDALVITFLLALIAPSVAITLWGHDHLALLSAAALLAPAGTVMLFIVLAQIIRIARGGVTLRVALVGLGATLIYALVAWASSALLSVTGR